MSQQWLGMSKQSEVEVRLNDSNLTGFRPFVQRVFGQLSEVVRLFSNFVPKRFTKDKEFTKRHKKETAPYNLHEWATST